MIYTLNELLTKMGAPEAREKGSLRWHSFDKDKSEITSFAEIRVIDDGRRLIAELQRLRHNYEDDAGTVHPVYIETFYMHAEAIGEKFKVTKVAFDGEEYADPQRSIIELGLSIFHSRALDISILMVEQAFNKQDILRPIIDERPQFRNIPTRTRAPLKKESWGVVVPFRPRAETGVFRRLSP
jgi:hypothetical protein